MLDEKVDTHKDLDVYKEVKKFAKDIYQVTKQFPKEEIYGITSQMRRSAISITSNIAEGSAPDSSRDFRQFLNIALGSMVILDTQLEFSKKFSYMKDPSGIKKHIIYVCKMLTSLKRAITKYNNRSPITHNVNHN